MEVEETAHVKHFVLPGYERRRELVVEGESVSAFLERSEWTFNLPTICVVNGKPVLRKDWATTTMSTRDNILFYSKPHGGGGGSGGDKIKVVVGLVAMVALAAFAPWAAGTLFAAGTFGFYATASAITLIGGFLISSFLNAKTANNDAQQVSQIYSLSASGNAAAPYQSIPVQYGRLKTVPKFAALPWTDFQGNEAFLNVLLATGAGKYSYEQLLFDDTPFWISGSGLQSGWEDITYQFCDPGDPFTLFPSNVITSSEVNGQELSLTPLGWFIVNNAGTTATDLFFDFVLPAGLQGHGAHGEILNWTIHVNAEVQEVDNAGSPVGPVFQVLNNDITYNTVDPQRISFRINLANEGLNNGRWRGRVWRNPDSLHGTQATESIIWAGFRAYLEGSNTFPSTSVIGLRMRASEKLSGNSAKKIGVIQTRILPVWNGSAFVDTATRNAWWAFYDAATNIAYGAQWPANKIDFQTIVDQAAAATARGDHFDYVFDSAVTVQAALDRILASNRAKVTWLGDVLSATRDEWKPIPNMLLSDQQIVRGSLELDFIMNSEDQSDCVQGQFLNEDTWQPAMLQYPPDSGSFTAENPASVELAGIVDPDHMFRELRFLWKQSQLRRIRIRCNTEHDGRLLRFGTPVKIQSFLPRSWGASGEVVSYNSGTKTVTINRSDLPTGEAGQHYVEFRSKTGAYFGPVKCGFGAQPNLLVLDSTDLAAVETDLGMTISEAFDRLDGAEPPAFVWGLSTNLSRNCIVLSGRPNDERVQLEFTIDSEAVHDETGDAQPSLPTPPSYVDPRVPTIGGLTASFKQGVAEPLLSASWWPAKGAVYYRAQVSYDSGTSWVSIRDNITDVVFNEVVTRADLRLRVAGVGVGLQGPWATVDVTVPEITIAPDTVDPDSFKTGLKDYIMNKLAEQDDRITKALQLVASTAQEHDSARTLLANSMRANVSFTATAFSDFQVSYASYQVTVAAQFGSLTSSVTTNATAIASLDGTVAALFSLTLDVNGYVTGFESINTGETSQFQIIADKFIVAKPGVIGGTAIPVFQISTVGGIAKIAFRGDMFADGTVTATALSVATLSAISADLGTVTVGKIQSTDSKFLIDATNKRIVISD